MDTIRLPPDFREFLKLFVAHEVQFLLIGGYALNALGYQRATTDIDLLLPRSAATGSTCPQARPSRQTTPFRSAHRPAI